MRARTLLIRRPHGRGLLETVLWTLLILRFVIGCCFLLGLGGRVRTRPKCHKGQPRPPSICAASRVGGKVRTYELAVINVGHGRVSGTAALAWRGAVE